MQALKGVVILMTLAIAVLMTLIIYGLYQKSQNPDFKYFDLSGGGEAAATTPATAPAMAPGAPDMAVRAFGDITLPLPQGARITSATVSGERLVVVVDDTQVWVVDLATGQVLGRVNAQKAP